MLSLRKFILILGEVRKVVTVKLKSEVKVLVASDSMEIETFSWPGLAEDTSGQALFRFSADISCLESFESVDRDAQVAAGSGDFKIKWKNLNVHEEDEYVLLEGHEAPILSIGIDPNARILISSSCDGHFIVWNLVDQTELYKGNHFINKIASKISNIRLNVNFLNDAKKKYGLNHLT